MTIAIYYDQFGYGGVDTHLSILINNWPKKNDKFLIITNADNEGLTFFLKKTINPNITIKKLHNFYETQSCNYKFYKFLYLLKVQFKFFFIFINILFSQKIDILLVNNGGYPGGLSNFFAVILTKIFKPFTKVFYLLHHAPSGNKNLVFYLTQVLSFIIVLLKTKLITVSKASKSSLENNTPLKNIKVIYNGINASQTDFESIDLNQKFSIQKNKIIIGCIGPIVPHKGHDTIFNVFKNSNILIKNAHFVIVGTGSPEFETILKKKTQNYNIEKNVCFTGFIPGKSNSIIKSFDILVMPTIDFEGFGYSMAEALSIGVPVVASKVGAIPEVIINNESGVLIDPFDYNKWQLKLEKLVSSSTKRKYLGIQGKIRIENFFSGKQMSKNYYNYFLK